MADKLKIDNEFRNLIPPLSDEEFQQLKESIKEEGQRDPILSWKGLVIDGHHRLKVCRLFKIRPITKTLKFAHRNDVLQWIVKNQLSRRNLSSFAKYELIEKIRPLIEEKAKQNQITSTGGKNPKQLITKSGKPEPIKTDKELSKLSGLGSSAIHQAKTVSEKGSDAVKAMLRAGDVSLNAAYNEVRRQTKKKEIKKPVKAKVSAIKIKFTIIHGNAKDEICKLEKESIDLLVTSPPYFNQRSTLPAKSKYKKLEIGSDDDDESYLNELIDLFESVKPFLKIHANVAVNIGDKFKNGELMGIPWRFALAMKKRGFILRNEIIWSKTNPNPSPQEVRFNHFHENVFLFSLSRKNYFDADATREPYKGSGVYNVYDPMEETSDSRRMQNSWNGIREKQLKLKKEGRVKGSVWELATSSSRTGHHSTFPESLVEPIILSCSQVGGCVLDPFAGSGTSGVVALKNNREFVGIDLNKEFCKFMEERLNSI